MSDILVDGTSLDQVGLKILFWKIRPCKSLYFVHSEHNLNATLSVYKSFSFLCQKMFLEWGQNIPRLPLRVCVWVIILLTLGISSSRLLSQFPWPPASLESILKYPQWPPGHNGMRCYPMRSGGERAGNVWVWQFVFVVISHPHSLLSSYCIPSKSSRARAGAVHWHCLEIWSGVGRYIRCSLGDFFHLLTKKEFIAEFKRIELGRLKPWNSPQIKGFYWRIDFG